VTVFPAAETKEPGEIVRLAMESPEVKKPEHPAKSIKQVTATAKKPLRTNCTALPPGDFLQLHSMIDGKFRACTPSMNFAVDKF
jgi:hypothetical protein